jgi:excisionase family DNA binding protein
MYPKFDGISVYKCIRCSVMFGVDREVHQAYCPKCKGRTEIAGEGMMMFFPLHKQESVSKVSENLDNSGYPTILTADHVAEILGISLRMGYELMERKDFPLIRIGRLKRVNRDEFFKWLNQSKSD